MCCPCENPQYHTSTHFFDVAKNAPSELHTYDILTRAAPKKLLLSIKPYEILTRAGPKKHVKKVLKKSFRRAWISACYIRGGGHVPGNPPFFFLGFVFLGLFLNSAPPEIKVFFCLGSLPLGLGGLIKNHEIILRDLGVRF